MSAAHLVNACPVCGAEESLDALLARMIDDGEARGLIADVIAMSLPLGQDVLRYLRLHTPAKQRLRLATVRRLLAELVPDVQRAAVERHGRVWAVSPDAWRRAFAAVFANAERGEMVLPLVGNGYLYSVLTRQADRAEAEAEEAREAERRGRAHQAGVISAADALQHGVPAALIQSDPAPFDLAAAERAARVKAALRERLASRQARRTDSDPT